MVVSDARRVLASAEVVIDLDALVANYRRIVAEAVASGAGVAAMVKADGYGLGAVQVGRALLTAGCRVFFVANVAEGSELRSALRVERVGPETVSEPTILVLNGCHPGTEADLLAHDLVPVLNSLDQIDRWSRVAPPGVRLRSALHVDTGMHRLGLMRSEFERLLTERERLGQLTVELLMSHLASADERASAQNPTQRRLFERFATQFAEVLAGEGVPAARSLANSSGLFLGADYHFDLLRPGYCLYGGNPTPDRPNPMQPVVTLEAPIVQVRSVESGDSVGYGATYTATTPRLLATLAVGYADGFLRSSSGRGVVFVAGHRAPIVGRISMDLVTIDVTEVPERWLWLGAPVQLIGPNRPVDAVATDAGTIGYELLVDLGRRYSRRYAPVCGAD
ncbi:MAG: alanine racemase [Actinomycetota bacterium]|nr:alanine racemase [Actinomycetota bacterium]